MARIPHLPAAAGGPGRATGRMVFRPVAMRLALGGPAAVALGWVADLALSGRVGEGLLAALWFLAAFAALACLFWRPAVIVDDDAVELRNVVRDVRVPWARLEGVTTRYTLTLHADGRRHQSWAGAAPGRPSLAPRPLGGHRLPDGGHRLPGGVNAPSASRDLRADSGVSAFMVEQGWRSWRQRQGRRPVPDSVGEPEQVEVRWRPALPGIAAVAALLAAVVTLVPG